MKRSIAPVIVVAILFAACADKPEQAPRSDGSTVDSVARDTLPSMQPEVPPDAWNTYRPAREIIPGFFAIHTPYDADTLVRKSTDHPILYLPRSKWTDTLNVLEIRNFMSDSSPVVAIIGVRRTADGWERVFAAKETPMVGEMERVSEEEWGLYTTEPYEGWRHVWFGTTKLAERGGFIRDDSTRFAIAPPRVDTSTTALAVIARFRSMMPDTLLARRGACPFECCIYREWTTKEALPVYANPRSGEPVVFTLRNGEKFQAITGIIYISGLAVVAVEDTIGSDEGTLYPGDTVAVLESRGEGYYNIWMTNGKVVSMPIGWGDREWERARHHTMGRYGFEWWVKVRRKSGEEGWIKRGEEYIDGTDQCG